MPQTKESKKEYNRKYRLEHIEEHETYNKEWRTKNKKRYLEWSKNYYKENKERLLIDRQKYQERLKKDEPVKRLLIYKKKECKQKNLPFALTVADIVVPSHCPILGIPISLTEKHGNDNRAELDRIFGDLGYIKGNIQILSRKANRMKSNASFEELVKIGKWASKQIIDKEN